MEKRTIGIIATIATAVLCGCPGIFLCIFGALGAAGIMPYTTTLNNVTNTGTMPSSVGFGLLCLSVIFIAIPIVVGVVTLRNKPAAQNINGPIPPAL